MDPAIKAGTVMPSSTANGWPSRAIESGTMLIEQGTEMPNSIGLGTESYLLGWSTITNFTRFELRTGLREAGWIFGCLAGELKKTGFGLNEDSRTRRAISQVIKKVKSQAFNCLEIAEIANDSFMGVPYVKVIAFRRHIQVSPCLEVASRIQRRAMQEEGRCAIEYADRRSKR